MQSDILKIALIPAYKPSELLISLLKGLKDRGFCTVTVNDGSGDEYDNIFAEAGAYSTVLEHKINLGKGAALKTGLCFISRSFREPYVIVTLDADGQHSIADAERAAQAAGADPDALILGSRAFSGKVPLKSRLGNAITRAVFAVTSGKKVYDTQTGLRAFSHLHTARMIDIAGDRYEYEMNVLMDYARSKTAITEIPIETIYIDNNSSSHFHPVRDSYRIYKEILKFSASSLVSFCIDYLMFCILSALTGAVAVSNVAARAVSSVVNYEINRRVVFKSTRPVKQSAPRYFALVIFILLCNTLLLTFLTQTVGMNTYAAKILTESVMFIVSWAVQHSSVFADSTDTAKGEMIMKKMKHRYLWAACYGAVLALFTGYVMLDTFVIPTVSATDAGAINTAMFETLQTTEKPEEDDDKAETADKEEKKPEKSSNRPGKDKSSADTTKPTDTDTAETKEKPAVTSEKVTVTEAEEDTVQTSSSAKEAVTESSAETTEAVTESSAASAETQETTASSAETSSKKKSSHAPKEHSGTHSSDSSDKPSSGSSGKSKPGGNSKSSSSAVVSNESVSGETYKDENISITMSEYYENNTKIYVADVKLSSAQYLKTAFANDSFGKNVTAATSEIAAAKNAILAINGDYYGARESGYVIRNGIIYRSTGSADTDVLCIYADGHFEITNSSEKTAEQLLADGVWQAFSFGPALVTDGTISVTKNQEVGKAMASNPRTAIGIIDDLHYVFVVADGRTSESAGLSLSQLASFMKSTLGVTTAYNLDGGGSTTMYYDGKVINNPTTSGNSIKERSVSDIVYIG